MQLMRIQRKRFDNIFLERQFSPSDEHGDSDTNRTWKLTESGAEEGTLRATGSRFCTRSARHRMGSHFATHATAEILFVLAYLAPKLTRGRCLLGQDRSRVWTLPGEDSVAQICRSSQFLAELHYLVGETRFKRQDFSCR